VGSTSDIRRNLCGICYYSFGVEDSGLLVCMARWNRVNAYRRFKGIYRLHVQALMSSRRKGCLEDEGDTLRISAPLLGVTTQNTRIQKKILISSPPAVVTFQCSKTRIVGLLLLLLFEWLSCKKNLILFEHASLSVGYILFGDNTSFHW